MDRELLERQLSELPLYIYDFFDPKELEFNQRIRWICENECPMYGQSWACPPGVGDVEACKCRCLGYENCLLVSSIVEVRDITDMEETLATRPDHEALTDQVAELMRAQGVHPYILSTEACALCPRCAILDGEPCRFPEKMHPCVESHGINVVPVLESRGLEFQFGANVVTWISLLFF
jgi:predicted metal-binding protein